MRFSHPIFICNLSETKEVEILKGTLVLFSFGFNKTKNVKNIWKTFCQNIWRLWGLFVFKLQLPGKGVCTIFQQAQVFCDSKETVR